MHGDVRVSHRCSAVDILCARTQSVPQLALLGNPCRATVLTTGRPAPPPMAWWRLPAARAGPLQSCVRQAGHRRQALGGTGEPVAARIWRSSMCQGLHGSPRVLRARSGVLVPTVPVSYDHLDQHASP